MGGSQTISREEEEEGARKARVEAGSEGGGEVWRGCITHFQQPHSTLRDSTWEIILIELLCMSLHLYHYYHMPPTTPA